VTRHFFQHDKTTRNVKHDIYLYKARKNDTTIRTGRRQPCV